MAADFSQLTAEVERIKQVRPSIVAIIEGIADRVQAAVDADNAGDNSQLATLSADLRAEADEFARVAVAGTPTEGGTGETGGGTTEGGTPS
jgi:hypothetical protein